MSDKDITQASLFTDEEVSETTEQTLARIRASAVACKACDCHTNRTDHDRIVFSDGSPDADLMIVSEAPGRNEDIQGVPFVGKAGEHLNKIIKWMGLDRKKDIYIANILKCWPGPGNPTPTAKQAKACLPFLEAQIRCVKPKLIITLGLVSTRYLTDDTRPMKDIHGKCLKYNEIDVIPSYHPASFFYGTQDQIDAKLQTARSDWIAIRNTFYRISGKSPFWQEQGLLDT